MLVAEQEHATEQATTEQEPTTTEQPIEAAAAVEADAADKAWLKRAHWAGGSAAHARGGGRPGGG